MEIRDRYRDYIPVYTDGSRDGNDVACASFSIKHRDCLTRHPYLLLKFGQLLKPWSKLKSLLHPNTLFLQTHFRVSKLYRLGAK